MKGRKKRKPVDKRKRLTAWLLFLFILFLLFLFYSISGMGVGDVMGREMEQKTSSVAPDDSTDLEEGTEEQMRVPRLSWPKPSLFGH